MPRTRALPVAVTIAVALLAVIGGACRPPAPELREPTSQQRASTTVPPTTGVPSIPAPTLDTAPSTGAPSTATPNTGPGTGPGSSAPATTGSSGSSSGSGAPKLPDGPTTVAQARSDLDRIEVFDEPGAAVSRDEVANPGQYGNLQVFVVLERRPDGWLRVLLPVRPNGSAGWVREADVTLAVHNYRIQVSLSGFSMEVRRGDEVVLEAPIGVGTSDTPTPAATYFTWVLLAPTNSGYGEYAYGLSGFSEVLGEFAGGDARLGIHGTDDASSIGRTVSHGCIRIHDTTVTTMVEDLGLPLGVPVEVTA